MLSFANMLQAPFERLSSEKKRPPPPDSGPILKARSQGRYRLIMEHAQLTTGEIAGKRGISHMGCLSTLYEMEKEGLVERLGTRRPTGRGKATIVWGWVKQ